MWLNQRGGKLPGNVCKNNGCAGGKQQVEFYGSEGGCAADVYEKKPPERVRTPPQAHTRGELIIQSRVLAIHGLRLKTMKR